MLAKAFIFTVLVFAGLTQVIKEPWETNLQVSGFGTSFHVNLTGVSEPEENGFFYDVNLGDPVATSQSGTTSAPTTSRASADCDNIESRVCQNFAEERQHAINNQINEELTASYKYMAMGTFFSRDDPNKMGFADFFFKASAEERDHAIKLIEYQNQRGGRVTFYKLEAPTNTTWPSGLAAMEGALKLERHVNNKLLALHQLAETDPHLQDFLETHYLSEQVDSIRELSGYVSQLKNLQSSGLGEFIFDDKLKK